MLGRGQTPVNLDACARDLSATGAYIYLDDVALSVGERVRLEIRLPVAAMDQYEEQPETVPMVGRGRVRRIESAGFALSFDRRLRFA